MTDLDRRSCLAAAALFALAASPSRASPKAAMYDYLLLDLPFTPGGSPARALADVIETPALRQAGGKVLGVWAPQLGWRSSQAAVLLTWQGETAAREAQLAALARGGGVLSARRDRLSPTIRPQAADRPKPGGVYVHRWFAVRREAVDEFVEISAEGWRDFEARFDANIYGLFRAEETDEDRGRGVTRLLLLTRYGDHGVWETSRDPTTDAMAAFRRRQQLTLDSWAASSLLVGPSKAQPA